ncbi:hypothetical protein SBRY_30605 [Actinacidiphila bryophytorum]|uniref:Uncharacterized protein n=1 Tax=Actinacidiphila bryophytorum TaxID=1436133 RepID=A0A9W4MH07_9ACTN|nr:hypothetical protein SBRY_30605 [Actinacidiphila bryophytorum]
MSTMPGAPDGSNSLAEKPSWRTPRRKGRPARTRRTGGGAVSRATSLSPRLPPATTTPARPRYRDAPRPRTRPATTAHPPHQTSLRREKKRILEPIRAGSHARLGIPFDGQLRPEKRRGIDALPHPLESMRIIAFNSPSLSSDRVTREHCAAYLVPRRGPGARAHRDEGGDIHAPAFTLPFRAPPTDPETAQVRRAGRGRHIGGAARDGGRLAHPGNRPRRRRRWRHTAASERGRPAEDRAERHDPRQLTRPALRHPQLDGVVRHFRHRRTRARDHHRPDQQCGRRADLRPRLAARAARLDPRLVHRRQHLLRHRPGRRDHRRPGGRRQRGRVGHQRERGPAAARPGRHPLHRRRRLHADPLPGRLRRRRGVEHLPPQRPRRPPRGLQRPVLGPALPRRPLAAPAQHRTRGTRFRRHRERLHDADPAVRHGPGAARSGLLPGRRRRFGRRRLSGPGRPRQLRLLPARFGDRLPQQRQRTCRARRPGRPAVRGGQHRSGAVPGHRHPIPVRRAALRRDRAAQPRPARQHLRPLPGLPDRRRRPHLRVLRAPGERLDRPRPPGTRLLRPGDRRRLRRLGHPPPGGTRREREHVQRLHRLRHRGAPDRCLHRGHHRRLTVHQLLRARRRPAGRPGHRTRRAARRNPGLQPRGRQRRGRQPQLLRRVGRAAARQHRLLQLDPRPALRRIPRRRGPPRGQLRCHTRLRLLLRRHHPLPDRARRRGHPLLDGPRDRRLPLPAHRRLRHPQARRLLLRRRHRAHRRLHRGPADRPRPRAHRAGRDGGRGHRPRRHRDRDARAVAVRHRGPVRHLGRRPPVDHRHGAVQPHRHQRLRRRGAPRADRVLPGRRPADLPADDRHHRLRHQPGRRHRDRHRLHRRAHLQHGHRAGAARLRVPAARDREQGDLRGHVVARLRPRRRRPLGQVQPRRPAPAARHGLLADHRDQRRAGRRHRRHRQRPEHAVVFVGGRHLHPGVRHQPPGLLRLLPAGAPDEEHSDGELHARQLPARHAPHDDRPVVRRGLLPAVHPPPGRTPLTRTAFRR